MFPPYCSNNLNFDCLQSGVNNDLNNNLPLEHLKLHVFKHIFDEDRVQHIVDETNKFYNFLVKNSVLSKHSKLQSVPRRNNQSANHFLSVFVHAHLCRPCSRGFIGERLSSARIMHLSGGEPLVECHCYKILF